MKNTKARAMNQKKCAGSSRIRTFAQTQFPHATIFVGLVLCVWVSVCSKQSDNQQAFETIYLPQGFDSRFEDVKIRVASHIVWPNEVSVHGPKTLYRVKRGDDFQILIIILWIWNHFSTIRITKPNIILVLKLLPEVRYNSVNRKERRVQTTSNLDSFISHCVSAIEDNDDDENKNKDGQQLRVDKQWS